MLFSTSIDEKDASCHQFLLMPWNFRFSMIPERNCCSAKKQNTVLILFIYVFNLGTFRVICKLKYCFRFGEEKTSKSPYVFGCAEVKWRSYPVQKLDTFINNATSTHILKVSIKRIITLFFHIDCSAFSLKRINMNCCENACWHFTLYLDISCLHEIG